MTTGHGVNRSLSSNYLVPSHCQNIIYNFRDSTPLHIQKRRLTGAGRHIHNVEFEKNLLEWIKEKQLKGEKLSRRIIKMQASQMSSNYPECFEVKILFFKHEKTFFKGE